MITDPIGGVIVSMLDSSMVDRVFEPWSGQTKDYEIGICCFSVKHAALSSNVSEGTTNLRTDCWFSHLSEGTTNLRTDCWFSHLSEGTKNLRTDCWFSHLSEGGDKSTDRLLIQSSVWGRRQIYGRTVDSVICLRGRQIYGWTVDSVICLRGRQIYGRTVDSVICLRGRQIYGRTVDSIICLRGRQIYGRTVDSVICLREATNLPTDCWFNHLSEGGDKSTDGLLIQSFVWGERQIYRRTVDSVICLREATNLRTDCWFSHLSEGSDKSTDGLLIQPSSSSFHWMKFLLAKIQMEKNACLASNINYSLIMNNKILNAHPHMHCSGCMYTLTCIVVGACTPSHAL
jgi:hypothetical protein